MDDTTPSCNGKCFVVAVVVVVVAAAAAAVADLNDDYFRLHD